MSTTQSSRDRVPIKKKSEKGKCIKRVKREFVLGILMYVGIPPDISVTNTILKSTFYPRSEENVNNIAWYCCSHDDTLEIVTPSNDVYDQNKKTFCITNLCVIFCISFKNKHKVPSELNCRICSDLRVNIKYLKYVENIESIVVNRSICMSNIETQNGRLGFSGAFYSDKKQMREAVVGKALSMKTRKECEDLIVSNLGVTELSNFSQLIEKRYQTVSRFAEFETYLKTHQIPLKDCDLVTIVNEWLKKRYTEVNYRNNTIIIIGKSQIGKSVMMKCLTVPPLHIPEEKLIDYHQNDINFGTYEDSQSDFLIRILDDPTFDGLPIEKMKGLMGSCSFSTSIRVLYGFRKVWPCPTVILFNPDSFRNFIIRFGDLDWLIANVEIYPSVNVFEVKQNAKYKINQFEEEVFDKKGEIIEIKDENYLLTNALNCSREELEMAIKSNDSFPCFYNVQKYFSNRNKQVVTQVPIPIRPTAQPMEEVHQSNEMEVEVAPPEDMGFIQTGYSQQYI
ncbi:hypothetical protein EIN_326180 [Entamoeba invadens IP1]|uniref:Uncharacterized protein n=1 Tax=Entamoeba invadens IP1 TaxID=370355 RepID=L7FL09_ENTIV|nr:hypothetical protein EIN_326180 [Entamoeba invadens IP1]ELP87557.1 hypothetical protein EIN_326180 [Entamoeba invadens IP1]|eukprot:XP_004254328.1 hypothetical protein EIN_326180 [Entamoeba invadens IP1]